MIVLFALSWRLGPILAGVIIATGLTATLYKDQTKAVENDNAAATNEMNNIANQAFESITTVRLAAALSLELTCTIFDWEGGKRRPPNCIASIQNASLE